MPCRLLGANGPVRFAPPVLGLALLAGLVSPRPPAAAPLRRADLLDLVRDARIIVTGTVISVVEGVEPRSGHPYREVTLRLGEVLKGRETVRGRNGWYRFRQPAHALQGDPKPGRWSSLGLPEYRLGEEVLLFLAGTDRRGWTAPIGLEQGKFTIHSPRRRDGVARLGRAEGSRLVRNALDNANLALVDPELPPGSSARAAAVSAAEARLASVRLTTWERQLLTRRETGPVSYPRLAALVRKLAAERRNERGRR